MIWDWLEFESSWSRVGIWLSRLCFLSTCSRWSRTVIYRMQTVKFLYTPNSWNIGLNLYLLQMFFNIYSGKPNMEICKLFFMSYICSNMHIIVVVSKTLSFFLLRHMPLLPEWLVVCRLSFRRNQMYLKWVVFVFFLPLVPCTMLYMHYYIWFSECKAFVLGKSHVHCVCKCSFDLVTHVHFGSLMPLLALYSSIHFYKL